MRAISLSVASVLLLIIASVHTVAQTSITPTTLNSGRNVITITAPDGIKELRTTTSSVILQNTGVITGCPKSYTVIATVNTTSSSPPALQFIVTDCRNIKTVQTFNFNVTTPPRTARGTVQVSPIQLYSGNNIITITSPVGIRDIQASYSRLLRVEGDGPQDGCPTTRQIKVFCNSASESVTLSLLVTDCNGKEFTRELTNRIWTLDHNLFGRVEVGETVCQEFRISTGGSFGGVDLEGQSEILDSVTIPESNDYILSLRLPTTLPYRIRPGEVYRYTVCITPNKTGTYSFPVITWMRRSQPAGGLTTYPVADTGIARVVPHYEPPPPRKPDTLRTPPPVIQEPVVTDPTTFRSVAIPNAVIPKKGKFFVGNYDLLGLEAGYSFADWGMVIAGGALPTPDDWGGNHGEMFGAYSVGFKLGKKFGDLNLAAGYQYGRSIYDKAITVDTVESKITIHAPYAAVSYGTDDSRVSFTFGYVFKHHTAVVPDGRISNFDENARILAFGGDYRFANHWKIAGEVASIQTVSSVPIILTARYFTNTYGLDFGVAYVGITHDGTPAPKIPIVPVISAVFVF